MALNPDREGYAHPPYVYEVSREKVREYAAATGVADPAIDGDPPGTATAAPPAFAAAITARALPMVIDDDRLGASWDLLHVSQSFDLHRAVRVGDVLTCTPRVERIVARSKADLLDVVVDVEDAQGAQVLRAASTLMVFDRDDGS